MKTSKGKRGIVQDDAEGDSKEEWVESRIGTFQKDAGHSFLPVKLSLSTSVFFKWESPSASSCSLPSSFPPRHPHHCPRCPISTQVLLVLQMPPRAGLPITNSRIHGALKTWHGSLSFHKEPTSCRFGPAQTQKRHQQISSWLNLGRVIFSVGSSTLQPR